MIPEMVKLVYIGEPHKVGTTTIHPGTKGMMPKSVWEDPAQKEYLRSLWALDEEDQ